jgi:hypothetical protein
MLEHADNAVLAAMARFGRVDLMLDHLTTTPANSLALNTMLEALLLAGPHAYSYMRTTFQAMSGEAGRRIPGLRCAPDMHTYVLMVRGAVQAGAHGEALGFWGRFQKGVVRSEKKAASQLSTSMETLSKLMPMSCTLGYVGNRYGTMEALLEPRCVAHTAPDVELFTSFRFRRRGSRGRRLRPGPPPSHAPPTETFSLADATFATATKAIATPAPIDDADDAVATDGTSSNDRTEANVESVAGAANRAAVEATLTRPITLAEYKATGKQKVHVVRIPKVTPATVAAATAAANRKALLKTEAELRVILGDVGEWEEDGYVSGTGPSRLHRCLVIYRRMGKQGVRIHTTDRLIHTQTHTRSSTDYFEAYDLHPPAGGLCYKRRHHSRL